MPKNKNAIATDLKRLDAHVVQPHEYEDAPELTDTQLAAADVHEGGKLIRRGRPPSPTRKQSVKLRIDPDVLAVWRASGPGWQTRINDTLKRAAAVVVRTGNKAVTLRKSQGSGAQVLSSKKAVTIRVRRKAAAKKHQQQPKARA
jgi:uncharacterized protein (DUF4415 family)